MSIVSRMGQFSLIAFLFQASAFAYTHTLTDSGRPVRWKIPELQLVGNPINASGISEDEFRSAVVRGLQRWKAATSGKLNFDYWQGTDPKNYEPNSDLNGHSSIYFASNLNGSAATLTPNVLGLTEVWYDTDSGRILEADIILNDYSYQFTTDPSDTSGFGRPSGGGNSRRVYIENVITHEIGHALGLSHSGNLQATMLFMESPEQAFLGCDEQHGIRSVYFSHFAPRRGVIEGKVDSARGSVVGAQVQAISRRRGTVMASALTDHSGRYRIEALEPGEYFLMVEPFFAGPQALPNYYASMVAHVCPDGGIFGRTFLSNGNRLESVRVRAGRKTDAPDFEVGCAAQSGAAAVISATESSEFWSAPDIFSGASGGFGFVDRFGSASTRFYNLSDIEGDLEIRVLSYSLYSPVKLSLSLLDESGNSLDVETFDAIYEGTSGYVNQDTALQARGLPRGNYTLELSGRYLNPESYPAGPISLDNVPFAVITGSVNSGSPALMGELPFNARCRMDENFPAYVSPKGLPPRLEHAEDDSIGFCGSIRQIGNGDAGPRPPDGARGASNGGASPGAIAGWLSPWAIMLLAVRLLRRLELRLRRSPANV